MAKDIAKLMAELQFDECRGTVRDRGNFNAERDAEILRKAMKGLGKQFDTNSKKSSLETHLNNF